MTASRRTFLSVVAATSATTCLGALAGCAGSSGPSGRIAAGDVSDLAVGGVLAVEGAGVAVLRDAAGLWAVTTICTHLQCDMQEQGTIEAAGLRCDCHDSEFTADGDRVSGPAMRDLDNFAVELASDGTITVDADTLVDPGTRTAV